MSGSYATAAHEIPLEQTRTQLAANDAHLSWFAIQTRYRYEKKVVAQLTRKSVNVYLPLRTERHAWSDRQRTVTIPLFPGYAFVHIAESRGAWQPILQTAGLIGFVSFG